MSSPDTTRRRLPLWKKLLVSSCILALGALAIEFAWRGSLWFRGHPYDADAKEREIGDLVDPMRKFLPNAARRHGQGDWTGTAILHPYTGCELQHDSGGVLHWFREERKPGDFCVLVMGASVSAAIVETSRESILSPLRSDARLAQRNVVVLDFATPMFKQPQQLMRLAWLASFGYRPDAVIELDGFSEVAFGLENARTGTHPLYPGFNLWAGIVPEFGADGSPNPVVYGRLVELRDEALASIERWQRWHLCRSAVFGALLDRRLVSLRKQAAELRGHLYEPTKDTLDAHAQRQLHGPDFAGVESAIESSARAWFEDSIAMSDLCRRRGIVFVHALQPALFDEGSKSPTAEELALPLPAASWKDGPRAGYPRLRELAHDLAANDVTFVDLSRVFAECPGTMFTDPVHLTPAGYARLGHELAAILLAALPPALAAADK